MNLLLLDKNAIVDGVAIISGRRAKHIVDVLGARVGSRLKVGVIGQHRGKRGDRGIGTIRAIRPEEVEIEIAVENARQPVASAPRPAIDLVLALPRPQAIKRILEHVSTLGVGSIDLVNSWRVEKSYFASPQLRPETIRRRLITGAEQGMTTWLPDVSIHPLLVPFVEGLPVAQDEQRLIAHPDAAREIEEVVRGDASRIRIAIGPEGGWIDREVETFASAGFEPTRLGNRVLRVETAVVAALAQLSLLLRRCGRGSW